MFIYYKHQFFFEGFYTNLMVLQLHWFLKLGDEIEPAAVQIGEKRKKPELYSDVRLTGPVLVVIAEIDHVQSWCVILLTKPLFSTQYQKRFCLLLHRTHLLILFARV